ncbi:hypothetical protein ABIF20_000745 [Bradyrhizobium japonicum]
MSSNPTRFRPRSGLPQVGSSRVSPQQEKADTSAAPSRDAPRLRKITLDLLSIGFRRLVSDVVDELARSFSVVGQIQPISVRRSDHNPEAMELICGAHRVAAAKMLHWPTIDALLFDGALDLSLVEIAENLHRKELSVYDKACLQAKWLKTTRQKGVQDAQPGGVQPHDKGYSQAARSLGAGTTREQVRRSEKIASISEEVVPLIYEYKLDDHQGALLDIAKAPTATAQINIAREYAGRRRKPRRTLSARPTVSSDGVGQSASTTAPMLAPSSADPQALPALEGSDADVTINELVNEWGSCRLRILLRNASEYTRKQFLNEKFLPEIGIHLQDEHVGGSSHDA